MYKAAYSDNEIIGGLQSLKDLRVLAIGEAIIDEYHFVTPLGKCPKGIHIVAQFMKEEKYAGGILACANHLAGFCSQIELVTAIGGNGEEFMRANLKPNIIPKFFYYPEAPTIIKRRFIDSVYINKLFEIYVFSDTLATELERDIGNYIADVICDYDLILVADYGHGLLTSRLIKLLCDKASFLAVNAQSNTASIGYNPITKYPKANFFCLGEPEIHLAFQDKHADIRDLIMLLAKQVKLPGAVAVTRGPRGSIIYDAGRKEFHQTPALSQKVLDTVGAGDAFLSLTSACLAKSLPADLVGFIGNAAGSLAIEILGNKTSIEPEQLFNFVKKLLREGHK